MHKISPACPGGCTYIVQGRRKRHEQTPSCDAAAHVAGWTLRAEWGSLTSMTTKAKPTDQAIAGAPARAESARCDVAVMGRGNSAALTALALAQSGFSVWAELVHGDVQPAAQPPSDARDTRWQRVLALSPGARRALETLGVWQRLKAGHAPVADIAVGGPNHGDLPLRFADAKTPDRPVDVLSHIVSLADLTEAIGDTLRACTALGGAAQISAAAHDFNPQTGTLTFADTTQLRVNLLVDASGAQSRWRTRAGIACLHYDYRSHALSAEVALGAPHGQVARQVFLADGPLAILPLPAPTRAALVWSLPARKAAALAQCDEDVFNHELNVAARTLVGPFEHLALAGPRAYQPLKAQIAEAFTGTRLALVGEAAHVIHPLAGQGMNLTLRDIGALVDTLCEARRLGLACSDATMLENYARLRRADALAGAFGTHGLAEIFSGPRPMRAVAATGLRGVGFIADNWPELKNAFRRQADQGLGPLSDLFAGAPSSEKTR